MIISRTKVESQPTIFYKGRLLTTNNLSNRDKTFLIILRDPSILSAKDLFIASSFSEYFGSLRIYKEDDDLPLRYPSDTSSVLGNSAKGIYIPHSKKERLLYIQQRGALQREYITNAALIYINGLVVEILQNKTGVISSSHNYTIYSGRRYAIYMEDGDYWEINNLSAHSSGDQIFFGFAFWLLPDTDPEINLYINWRGQNASYSLHKIFQTDLECVEIKKYWDGHSQTELSYCCGFGVWQSSQWNTAYWSMREGYFCRNKDYWYYPITYWDNESERWFDKVKFVVQNDPIYFGDFFLINFPSNTYRIFATPTYPPKHQWDIHDLLGSGNFYWEL